MSAKGEALTKVTAPPQAKAVRRRPASSILTEHDIYLFKEGSHGRLYEKLGAHATERDGKPATRFAVWAPNAAAVSLIGDFNGWDAGHNPLQMRSDGSGIWEGTVPGLRQGAYYKYRIRGQAHGHEADKGDPFAFYWQLPPSTASRVWSLDYEWNDHDWMTRRAATSARNAPMSIYEMHVGSWRRIPEEGNRPLTYRELAEPLAGYVRQMGFTHVELMPVMEHPFYGSWGYQTTGYFAPTSRYGTPQDFMYLVDYLHGQGIGVILDWMPSHFPNDGHGLVHFDGTHLFEHADPQQGYHPEWNSCIFNYGRHEVRAFLESSAHFWLDQYHADGLRVDAVASMLYLDYARKEGEWIPNEFGGRENLAAVSFLRHLNEEAYRNFPDVQTIAEESTAWPRVSGPVSGGGLGFGYKWNMGWMHDTLEYLSVDPTYRGHHHDQLTFSICYAFDENFVLPLSHDEVVYGKGSLVGKMPGDEWQQFANLRLLFGYMWAHPGKKLLFMGGEFGQRREWQHEESLQWHVLGYPLHEGVRVWVSDLNRCYRAERALHDFDCERGGFEWIDCNDRENSVVSFIRRNMRGDEVVLVVLNFTPVVRSGYTLGVPRSGRWEEILNSDSERYGGSGIGNMGGVDAQPHAAHGRDWSLRLTLPPLSALFFKSGGH